MIARERIEGHNKVSRKIIHGILEAQEGGEKEQLIADGEERRVHTRTAWGESGPGDRLQ